MDFAAILALVDEQRDLLTQLARLGPVIVNDAKVAELRRLTAALSRNSELVRAAVNRLSGLD